MLEFGVDAGKYSRLLLKNAKDALASALAVQDDLRPDLRAVVEFAADRTQIEGSSTICLLCLKGKTCHAINLGDSGFLLLRKVGKKNPEPQVITRSDPQQRAFNTPYQLGWSNNEHRLKIISMQTAAEAEEYSFQVRPGDVLVLATDGLFDNLSESTIAKEAFARGKPQRRADHLAQLARNQDLKPDDIAVVVADVIMPTDSD
mmetsp:Transcript_34411/g.74327  ORF Transcript_34411/g.74327 Transcript_34411/m.74327 type:complete len:203 (-) Transcript_34411:119-727(-)